MLRGVTQQVHQALLAQLLGRLLLLLCGRLQRSWLVACERSACFWCLPQANCADSTYLVHLLLFVLLLLLLSFLSLLLGSFGLLALRFRVVAVRVDTRVIIGIAFHFLLLGRLLGLASRWLRGRALRLGVWVVGALCAELLIVVVAESSDIFAAEPTILVA